MMHVSRRLVVTSLFVTVSVVLGLGWMPAATAQTVTVDFDNPAPTGWALNGVFQGIDFGAGQWAWEPAYLVNPTNHIYFASSVGTTRTFRFATGPRILRSLRVFTPRAGTLTLSDDTGQTFTGTVAVGSLQLVTTGWDRGSTTVSVNFTEGWALGVDDITYREAF